MSNPYAYPVTPAQQITGTPAATPSYALPGVPGAPSLGAPSPQYGVASPQPSHAVAPPAQPQYAANPVAAQHVTSPTPSDYNPMAAAASAIANATTGPQRLDGIGTKDPRQVGWMRLRINLTMCPDQVAAWVAEFTILETRNPWDGGEIPGRAVGDSCKQFQYISGDKKEQREARAGATLRFILSVLGFEGEDAFYKAGGTKDAIAQLSMAMGVSPGPFVGKQVCVQIKPNKSADGYSYVDFMPDRPLR